MARVEDLLPGLWMTHHPESIRVYRNDERRYRADNALLQSDKRILLSQLRKSKPP